jgi:hypothetical protein
MTTNMRLTREFFIYVHTYLRENVLYSVSVKREAVIEMKLMKYFRFQWMRIENRIIGKSKRIDYY